MMNATIIALRAVNLAFDALVSARGGLLVHHSVFSRSFGNVIGSRPSFRLDVSCTRFDRTLRTAVAIENIQEHNGEVYRSPMRLGSGGARFQNCLFTNCMSDGSHGGGIYVDEGSGTSLIVDRTGFNECRATGSGGGIYCICGSFEFTRSCCDATTAENGAAMYCEVSSSMEASTFYVSNINDNLDGAAVMIKANRCDVRYGNVTDVQKRDAVAALSFKTEQLILETIHFGRCMLASVLSLASKATVSRLNFIKNQGVKCLLDVNDDWCEFKQCSFVGDISTMIIKKWCYFTECIFTRQWDPSLFGGGAYTQGCRFNVGTETLPLSISGSEQCWEHRSSQWESHAPTAVEDETTGVTVGVIIGVLVIMGIIGSVCYVVYRFVCAKRRTDVQSLMYSQV